MGSLKIQITDIAGAYIEHSIVVTNFVAIANNQLKDTLDYENDIPKYFLFKEITDINKDELEIAHSPNVKIDFDELFDGIER